MREVLIQSLTDLIGQRCVGGGLSEHELCSALRRCCGDTFGLRLRGKVTPLLERVCHGDVEDLPLVI